MKNRIWYRIKSFGMASVLTVGLMVGCSGKAENVSAEYKNDCREFQENRSPVQQLLDLTVEQTEIAEPTEPPELTKAPELTNIPVPTEAPNQTEVVEPTETPESTGIPEPTEMPEATKAPELTEAAEPTTIPGQTGTPAPAMPEFGSEEEKPSDDKPDKNADFTLSVAGDTNEKKAGETLTYEVILENTGETALEQIELWNAFSDAGLSGDWEEAEGFLIKNDSNAVLEKLEAGEKKMVHYSVKLPEDYNGTIRSSVTGTVRVLPESMEEEPEPEVLTRSASTDTKVLPLKVDFEVKKTADRKMAVPGDTITYQICIRNTGERTIHSVLTTERFRIEGIHAEFLEKEGATLNGSKNQALIGKIEPGEAFGLQAKVTLPEDISGGKLINEVTVVTKETGSKTITAQAAVQLYAEKRTETPIPEENPKKQSRAEQVSSAYAASSSPKTGDPSETERFAGLMGAAMLTGISIFWYRKAKRKH